MSNTNTTHPIGTDDEVEALAKLCGWNNRCYMTPADYSEWCRRMRQFAALSAATVADKGVIEGRLDSAWQWIASAPHGDNCFVSDHYEGDPGSDCNCGKDSLLTALEAASSAEAAQPAPAATEGIGMLCPTAPDRIWLQVDPEPEEEGVPMYPGDEATWCADKINDTDTLYIRADLARSSATGDMVLVPREPTEAMVLAGGQTPGMQAVHDVLSFHQARSGCLPPWPGEGSPLAQAYRAMIAAAQPDASVKEKPHA